MSEYLDSAEEKLREIYHNIPPDKREDELVKFMLQKLWNSYKNGLRDGKKKAEQEQEERVWENEIQFCSKVDHLTNQPF